MFVGNPKKPQKEECEDCILVRELLESLEEQWKEEEMQKQSGADDGR